MMLLRTQGTTPYYIWHRYRPITMYSVPIDMRSLPSLVPQGLLNITTRAVVPIIEDNIIQT